MTGDQKKAEEIREKIYILQDQIDQLEAELYGLEDYKCVIPKEYNNLTDYFNNYKKGDEYSICDNQEDAQRVASHEAFRDTHHIVLLTEEEINAIEEYYLKENINNDRVMLYDADEPTINK